MFVIKKFNFIILCFANFIILHCAETIITGLEYSYFEKIEKIPNNNQILINAIFRDNKNKKIMITKNIINYWRERFEGTIVETFKDYEIIFTLNEYKARQYYDMILTQK